MPNDPQSPFITSGIRIGSPAITTRGFKEAECQQIAAWVVRAVLNANDERVIKEIQTEVLALCQRFPVYGS